jgi:hypothetical protein
MWALMSSLSFLDQVLQVGHVPSDLSIDGETYSADGAHLSVYGSLAAAEQFAKTATFSIVRTKLENVRTLRNAL